MQAGLTRRVDGFVLESLPVKTKATDGKDLPTAATAGQEAYRSGAQGYRASGTSGSRRVEDRQGRAFSTATQGRHGTHSSTPLDISRSSRSCAYSDHDAGGNERDQTWKTRPSGGTLSDGVRRVRSLAWGESRIGHFGVGKRELGANNRT